MVSTSISKKTYLSAYFTILSNARNNSHTREISQIFLAFMKSEKMLQWWQKQFGNKNLFIQQMPTTLSKNTRVIQMIQNAWKTFVKPVSQNHSIVGCRFTVVGKRNRSKWIESRWWIWLHFCHNGDPPGQKDQKRDQMLDAERILQ